MSSSHSTTIQQTSAPLPTGAVFLAAVFVASLVTAQVTAAKVIELSMPFSIPGAGSDLVLPGAALAIAVMFLASDCYTELYGKRAAQILVNTAFVMNFLVLALVWSTIIAPAADSSINPVEFERVLGASTNIVAGSLIAYIISQNYDVIVFHKIKAITDGRHLWLRNIISTGTSQILDTIIFVGIAFWLLPSILGLGPVLPGEVVIALIIGQYILKLGIAILDTPIVYLLIGGIRQFDSIKLAS